MSAGYRSDLYCAHELRETGPRSLLPSCDEAGSFGWLRQRHNMRPIFIYLRDRYKRMPVSIHGLTLLCVCVPILALGFYIRNDPPVRGGLPKVLLIAICSVVFIYGFLQATKWSRPLVVLLFVASSISAIFQNHATYSILNYMGFLIGNAFFVWTLYFRRDVREYYGTAGKTGPDTAAVPKTNR